MPLFFEQFILQNYSSNLSTPEFIYNYETLLNHNLTSNLSPALFKCCSNNIGTEYLNETHMSLNSSFDVTNPTHIFDLACILNTDIRNITNDKIDDYMIGFVIVEKGECKMHPDVYSINLICSHERRGGILMGLFIYSIINNANVTDKRGVLELANAYINTPGLCMYSKYGFVYDESMYDKTCFYDYSNLPMILNTNDYGPAIDERNERLIQIVNGNKSYEFPKPRICSIRQADNQLLYGMLINLFRFISSGNPIYVINKVLPNGDLVNYANISNKLMLSKLKKREKIEFLRNNISDLESNTMDTTLMSELYSIMYTLASAVPPRPPATVASTATVAVPPPSRTRARTARPARIPSPPRIALPPAQRTKRARSKTPPKSRSKSRSKTPPKRSTRSRTKRP